MTYQDRGNKKWKMQIILPQHRQRLSQWYREQNRKEKPEFDEQYLNQLAQIISEAKHEQYTVTVRIFGEFDETRVTGRIIGIDQQSRKIKIEKDDYDWPLWVLLDDILSIEKAS